jgi:hypothetical protein
MSQCKRWTGRCVGRGCVWYFGAGGGNEQLRVPSAVLPTRCFILMSQGAASRLRTRTRHPAIAPPPLPVLQACEYFDIRPVVVPLGPDYRLHGSAVARRINKNTVLVVASAPGGWGGRVGRRASSGSWWLPCR